tara:strand:+ start:513 stop:1133 length:621 start_codon:yes stop_codon:yes gene_type:complete
MKTLIIHQIFFNIGKELNCFPIFVKNKSEVELFCYENNIEYRYYTEDDIDEYLTDKTRDFYNSLTYEWQKIDFARYLIVNTYGGIYIDLDITITQNGFENFKDYILSKDYIINKWFNPKTNKYEITNSIMGFERNTLEPLIDYSIKETIIKSKMEVYKDRKIRFMLHTTGVRMFKRWCKINKLKFSPEITNYTKDYCCCSWIKNFK